MPELPEVEAARRAIEDHCVGKKIKKAIIADDPKVIDGLSASDFEAALVGKTVVSALRKGKNLWLRLDSPPFPSFQFGMAGAIYIKGVAITKYKRSAVKDNDEWPSKYSKLFVELEDGLELSFTDKRRFARVRLLKDPASEPPISELGPDAFLEPMTVDEFYSLLSKKKTSIKALLLDQSFISGIGNWVADEVLYQARIHPLQIASSFSKESCLTLINCIKEVIEKAIDVGADSSQFPDNWIFHSREKKPGKAFVDGKKIDFITAGGRTTAYVPDLQKLSGNQPVKAGGKPKGKTLKRKKSVDDSGDEEEDSANESASEGDEIAEMPKSKRELKPKGHTKKPPAKGKSKASDDDGIEASKGEETAKNHKSKKGLKPRGQSKKPPNKVKSKASLHNKNDDGNDGDGDGDSDDKVGGNGQTDEDEEVAGKPKSNRELKSTGRSQKPRGKTIPKTFNDGNEDESNDDDEDNTEDDDNDGQKLKPGRMTGNRRAKLERASKKKVANGSKSQGRKPSRSLHL